MSTTSSRLASDVLRERARQLIPAGCHTYSKGDDQFPASAPAFIAKGLGSHCWDLEGREYVDWGMGLRSVILGHAYPRVLDAVKTQLELGSNFTRPSPLEVELAELMVDLIPSAQMVKFAKNGSDVTSGAVRLARAYTGRDLVARSRDTGFFSFNDWFIGSTPMSAGVPKAVQDLTLSFDFNDLPGLERLFAEHPSQIACVILEPGTGTGPAPGYLEAVRDLTHRHGAILVFDEIISGFRWHVGGAQTYYGVTPDLSTFGKAMGNGFSVSALVGRRDILELGGLNHSQPRVFLLSATHGAETHELAAAIATISELKDRDAIAHIWKMGAMLQDGFNTTAREMGVEQWLSLDGPACSPYLTARDTSGLPSLPLRTLFLQETIAAGVLIPWIAICFSHTPADVAQTLEASRKALVVCRQALEAGDVTRFLNGHVVKPVFRKFN
jgi:glutamate-1-semialdehyde 2,1-aminomutase